MIKHNFTIKEIFTSAWQAGKNNAWFLFVISSIIGTIMVVTRHTGLIGGVINLVTSISLLTVALVIAHGKTPTYNDTVKSFQNYKITWHYLLASLLCLLIVLVGLLAVVLPGLYLAIRLQFYKFIVIENENMRPMEALKKSFEMTRGHFWKLTGFTLTVILFNILGALFFIIGLLVTIPISVIASAFLYKKLLPQTQENHTLNHHLATN